MSELRSWPERGWEEFGRTLSKLRGLREILDKLPEESSSYEQLEDLADRKHERIAEELEENEDLRVGLIEYFSDPERRWRQLGRVVVSSLEASETAPLRGTGQAQASAISEAGKLRADTLFFWREFGEELDAEDELRQALEQLLPAETEAGVEEVKEATGAAPFRLTEAGKAILASEDEESPADAGEDSTGEVAITEDEPTPEEPSAGDSQQTAQVRRRGLDDGGATADLDVGAKTTEEEPTTEEVSGPEDIEEPEPEPDAVQPAEEAKGKTEETEQEDRKTTDEVEAEKPFDIYSGEELPPEAEELLPEKVTSADPGQIEEHLQNIRAVLGENILNLDPVEVYVLAQIASRKSDVAHVWKNNHTPQLIEMAGGESEAKKLFKNTAQALERKLDSLEEISFTHSGKSGRGSGYILKDREGSLGFVALNPEAVVVPATDLSDDAEAFGPDEAGHEPPSETREAPEGPRPRVELNETEREFVEALKDDSYPLREFNEAIGSKAEAILIRLSRWAEQNGMELKRGDEIWIKEVEKGSQEANIEISEPGNGRDEDRSEISTYEDLPEDERDFYDLIITDGPVSRADMENMLGKDTVEEHIESIKRVVEEREDHEFVEEDGKISIRITADTSG